MQQYVLMATLLCIASPSGAQTSIKCGRAFAKAKTKTSAASLKACITACASTPRASDLRWCTDEQMRRANAKAATYRKWAEAEAIEAEERRERAKMAARRKTKSAEKRREREEIAVRHKAEAAKQKKTSKYAPGQQVAPATPSRPAVHFIPAGTFEMGSPATEGGRGDHDDDETPHAVTLTRSFTIMRTEVTQAQWSVVMGSSPSYFKCADCPVERVSWYDAVTYANTLSEREGITACYALSACKGACGTGCERNEPFCEGDYQCTVIHKPVCTGYRLPTEAEWEYAARAGSSGARHGSLNAVAWFDGNSGDRTHRSGRGQANAWGLVDMLGNVWEWTDDWYGNPVVPGFSHDPRGSEHGTGKVVRGGSWWTAAGRVRSANRAHSSPGRRYHYRGFRMVRQEKRQLTAIERSRPDIARLVELQNGCPSVKGEVRFEYRSSTLTEESKTLVDRIAEVMNLVPSGPAVTIAAHTDEHGSETSNLELSERRAEAVKRRLILWGVATARLSTVAYGEARPVPAGAGIPPPAAWDRNRRVEFSCW